MDVRHPGIEPVAERVGPAAQDGSTTIRLDRRVGEEQGLEALDHLVAVADRSQSLSRDTEMPRYDTIATISNVTNAAPKASWAFRRERAWVVTGDRRLPAPSAIGFGEGPGGRPRVRIPGHLARGRLSTVLASRSRRSFLAWVLRCSTAATRRPRPSIAPECETAVYATPPACPPAACAAQRRGARMIPRPERRRLARRRVNRASAALRGSRRRPPARHRRDLVRESARAIPERALGEEA